MNTALRLNRRITRLAVGRHLPYRTVRVRLTLLYGGLFLVSGAALMAITYALLVNAGFVFTLQNGPSAAGPPGLVVAGAGQGSFPFPGSATHPSARTMAHWRDVAQCMRANGVSQFPNPTSSFPAGLPRPADLSIGEARLAKRRFSMISDRDGAILAIPATVDMQSATFTHASAVCGYAPDQTNQTPEANGQRSHTRQQLLIQAGIALAAMSLLSLGLGWLMAGRFMQPLADSYEAQRQFVANASHELRAPLTRQRALIEVALASSEANVASLRKAHERVLVAEQHLEQLIEALLALTRGQAGLERRERSDLAALATQALQAPRPDIERLGLDVRATLDHAPTDGDPRLLEGLIANLIDNAIRHNTVAGLVEITTGTRDRHAFVSIANTGPTVPPDQIQRLFEPFERLGVARTRHDGGHGLGLSIVQSIADAHGATLTAHARAQGGLTIEISFPAAIAAGSRVPAATALAKRARLTLPQWLPARRRAPGQ